MPEWDGATVQRIEEGTCVQAKRVLLPGYYRERSAAAQTSRAWLEHNKNRSELPEVRTGNLEYMKSLDPRSACIPWKSFGRFTLVPDAGDKLTLVINNTRPGWNFLEEAFDAPPPDLLDHPSRFTAPNFTSRSSVYLLWPRANANLA